MPELVAILHSFVGLAAVLVGMASFLDPSHDLFKGTDRLIHDIEILLGVFIGGVTFTGSVIAFGKLRGSLSGKPLLLLKPFLLILLWFLSRCGWDLNS